MASKVNAVISQNIPLVLGEIANLQDDASPCEYTLNYKSLLNYCQINKVGWIAWSWDNDNCSDRQISSTGNFSNLTADGNDIVHNSNYGLLTVNAPKSRSLLNGCGTMVINRVKAGIDIALFPNPATDNLTIEVPVKATVCILNIQGQLIDSFVSTERRTDIDVSSFSGGVYVVEVKTESGVGVEKFVKQ